MTDSTGGTCMNRRCEWQMAANVSERDVAAGSPTSIDAEVGNAEYARWRTLPAMKRDEAHALEPLGISVARLRELLGETRESLRDRLPRAAPDWVDYFFSALDDGRESHGGHLHGLGLMGYLEPVLHGAQRRLRTQLQEHLSGASAAERARHVALAESCVDSLPLDSLGQAASRVAILEMHRMKERDELVGDTPEARFDDFLRHLRTSQLQDRLFAEYPVLVRVIAEKLQLWEESRREFFAAALRDREALVAAGLFSADESAITVTFGAGDTHNRGRTVAIVRTASGGVVFKPRSGHIDIAFADLLASTNDRVAGLDLRHPTVLDKGTHSWHQLIEAVPTSPADAELVGSRLGALTAILQLLQANDFHHENVILSKGFPYAIDTETLFHTERTMASDEIVNENFGLSRFRDSVTTVGILPSKIITSEDGGFFSTDISVVGYVPGQRSMLKVPILHGLGTDDMTVTAGYADEPDNDEFHRHDLPDRGPAFADGFARVMRAWADDAEELAGENGALAAFAGSPSREIPRPTMVYAKVMLESYHPDFLRDGRDRDLVLCKLLLGYGDSARRNSRIAAEIDSLRLGDIPYFAQPIEAEGSGGESALRSVQARAIRRLRPEEIRYELAAIEASYVANGSLPFDVNPVPRPVLTSGATVAAAAAAAAEDLAIYVTSLAARSDGGIPAWISLMVVPGNHWTVTAPSVGFYAGVAGIYTALAGVEHLLGAADLEATLDGMEAQLQQYGEVLRRGLDDPSSFKDGIDVGGYGQLGGFALACAHMERRRRATGIRDLLSDVLALIRMVAPRTAESDVVSGVAGGILSVLAVRDVVSDAELRDTLTVLVDRLLELAEPADVGLRWLEPETQVGLVGFSHGTAGIALALARAGVFLGRDDALEAARSALLYDDARYLPDSGDWPDLRIDTSDDDVMRAWCHGAPGELMARAEIAAIAPGLLAEPTVPLAQQAVESLLSTVREDSRYGADDSLCHGKLGNTVILQHLIDRGAVDSSLQSVVDDAVGDILRTAAHRGWRSGALRGVAIPDAMMGLSGTAWGLALLAAERRNTLSMLTLDAWPARVAISELVS